MEIFVLSTAAPPDVLNLFVKSNVTVVNVLFTATAFDTGEPFVDFPVLSTRSTRSVSALLFFILILTVWFAVRSIGEKLNSTFSQPGPTAEGVTTNCPPLSAKENFPAGTLFQPGSSALSLKFSSMPV